MPQLKSGRHVAVERNDLVYAINHGSSEQIYALILAYRLTIKEPQDLIKILPVVYFEEEKGTPPNAPYYKSGFLVQDILDEKADWSNEEIQEFKAWVEVDESLNNWASENFIGVDKAIKESILWDSEFITDEPENGPNN